MSEPGNITQEPLPPKPTREELRNTAILTAIREALSSIDSFEQRLDSIQDALRKEHAEIIDLVSLQIDRVSSTIDADTSLFNRMSENCDKLRSLSHRVSQIKIYVLDDRPRRFQSATEFNTPTGPIKRRSRGPMT